MNTKTHTVNRFLRLVALCLSVLLLTGCGDFPGYLGEAWGYRSSTSFSQMEYTRPDPTELDTLLEDCRIRAQKKGNILSLISGIQKFYNAYDAFYTNYALADIHYCADLTDLYWEEEYNYCLELQPSVDRALDDLYRMLAKSPMRDSLEADYFSEGFFSGYDSESALDDGYIALAEQESALMSRYYDILEQAQEEELYSEEYYTILYENAAPLLLELVKLRQEIARYCGFPGYAEYAYALHGRQYSPEQATTYLEGLADALYALYTQINASPVWEDAGQFCSEEDTFAYVQEAAGAMGGEIEKAFRSLQQQSVYDIGYSTNKYAGSFEVYLWSYGTPFVFLSPTRTQTDKLVFAHEFGHFANDYRCGGSYAGTDVAEVHSQAFEYLSLCYTQGSDVLRSYKLADSLCLYVECGAYALFEHALYKLSEEELTLEAVEDLYTSIGTRFGFDSLEWDVRDYAAVPHFFTEPMYNISYVVSNDLAMQIYQMELEDPGKGLELYDQCLLSEDSDLEVFARRYGLENPLSIKRLTKIQAFLQAALE